MAIYRVQGPDGAIHRIEGPDDASPQQVEAFAQQQFAQAAPKLAQERPINPTDGMSTGERLLAGAGKAFVDLGRGAGQMVGMVDQKTIDESRKYDAPLMETGAGMTGNVIGNVAGMLPLAFIPGANSIAGAAALGGVTGALQPTAEGESRLQNIGTGVALGGLGQYGLGKAATFAGNRLASKQAAGTLAASQNSVRDATLKAGQEAGYVVPPSLAGAGLGSRILEGISGKFKTNQAAAIKNQNVTDRLARQALGLADDTPLTRETMQAVRDRAFQRGYEPIASAGSVETDQIFKRSLDSIVKDYEGAARSFPGARPQGMHGPGKSDVMQMVDGLRTGAFDMGDALGMTRILREDANKAYAAGDKALGKATKKAASAIEDQIERSLQSAGKGGNDLLKNFRDARQLMAKAHSVEQAIVESGGKVNARVLGAALQRGKPLSGELKTIGAFANNFKDVARVPESGWANPITVMDAFGTSLGGAAGMGMGAAALPAARIGARSLMLNPAYQRGFVGPSYGPGKAAQLTPKMLKELERMAAGGLLGPSIYAAQQ